MTRYVFHFDGTCWADRYEGGKRFETKTHSTGSSLQSPHALQKTIHTPKWWKNLIKSWGLTHPDAVNSCDLSISYFWRWGQFMTFMYTAWHNALPSKSVGSAQHRNQNQPGRLTNARKIFKFEMIETQKTALSQVATSFQQFLVATWNEVQEIPPKKMLQNPTVLHHLFPSFGFESNPYNIFDIISISFMYICIFVYPYHSYPSTI